MHGDHWPDRDAERPSRLFRRPHHCLQSAGLVVPAVPQDAALRRQPGLVRRPVLRVDVQGAGGREGEVAEVRPTPPGLSRSRAARADLMGQGHNKHTSQHARGPSSGSR
ncbi:hypothetical protein E4K10_46350 [Streptomyces sp. T1317-0309]|nr:hypothetical protein E4K10_46350 [Streptomyces sp. T1317-0309]